MWGRPWGNEATLSSAGGQPSFAQTLPPVNASVAPHQPFSQMCHQLLDVAVALQLGLGGGSQAGATYPELTLLCRRLSRIGWLL